MFISNSKPNIVQQTNPIVIGTQKSKLHWHIKHQLTLVSPNSSFPDPLNKETNHAIFQSSIGTPTCNSHKISCIISRVTYPPRWGIMPYHQSMHTKHDPRSKTFHKSPCQSSIKPVVSFWMSFYPVGFLIVYPQWVRWIFSLSRCYPKKYPLNLFLYRAFFPVNLLTRESFLECPQLTIVAIPINPIRVTISLLIIWVFSLLSLRESQLYPIEYLIC